MMTKKRSLDRKMKGKEEYKCRICGTTHSVIHAYGLNICKVCFRKVAEKVGFRKY